MIIKYRSLSAFKAASVRYFEITLYVLGSVLLLAGSVVSYFSLSQNPQNWSAVATILSVIVAYVALAVNAALGKVNARKQHTINFISQTRYNSKIYREHASAVMDFKDETSQTLSIKLLRSKSTSDSNLLTHSLWLLNYWDFVAVGCHQGDFDFDAVTLNLRGMFEKIVTEFADVIGERRLEEPRSWQHLVWIYLYFASGNEIEKTLTRLGPMPTFFSRQEALIWKANGGA